MNDSNSTRNDDDLLDQAAQWVVRMNSEEPLSDTDYAAFNHWWMADPRCAQEFIAQNGMWHAFADFPADLRARQLGWLAEQAQRRPVLHAWRRAAGWSFAAAALLAMLIGGWMYFGQRGVAVATYATPTGETRLIHLADGSTAQLNTRTRLQWTGDAHARQILLLEGEALFNVVHDTTRPFRVLVDNSEIRVLGTRFNVYRKTDGEIIVTVLEGSVQVENQRGDPATAWQRVLHEHDQFSYRASGPVRDVHLATGNTAIQWRDGILEVREEPLLNVVGELTRYTDKLILARDPRFAALQVTGHFSIRDVPRTLKLLESIVPVTFTDSGGAFTLAYRATADKADVPAASTLR